MKTKFLILAAFLLIVAGMIYSCSEKEECENSEDFFYYYEGEKIFLTQIRNKILLKFSPSVAKEQILAIINSNAFLQPTFDVNLNFVVLAAKNKKCIPIVILESFKAREEVISSAYLYMYNHELQGLTDEFVIKLKTTTSYTQLQELAEKNFCTIGEENPFVKNQFMLYVAKTSDIDALQMSNLFYETGLFEFSEPNFIILNAFN